PISGSPATPPAGRHSSSNARSATPQNWCGWASGLADRGFPENAVQTACFHAGTVTCDNAARDPEALFCRAPGRSPTPTGQTPGTSTPGLRRSEEHTSELQSRENLVCRLLLEKKKKK